MEDVVVKNEENIGKPKKRRLKKNVFTIFLVLLLFVVVGGYTFYFQSSKRVLMRAFHHITTAIGEKYLMNKTIDMGNHYTVEGDFNLNIQSSYLESLARYSPDFLIYSNIFNNLSKTENHFVFKQDFKNKNLLMSLDSKYQDQELISLKYLVENNKDYYYMKDFKDSYIELGRNPYFKSLESGVNNKENMEYIGSFLLKSFDKHLKKSDFTKSSEKVQIGSREKSLQKITLELDNKKLVKLSQLILKDLQNDEKAVKILTEFDKDFKNEKIEDNEEILEKDQKIILSFYVGNITYSIKKYQIDIIDGKDTLTVDYQEEDKGMIHVYQNRKLEAILKIANHNNKVIIDIYDGDKQSLGQAKITNKEDEYGVDLDISDHTTKLKLSLKEELSKIRKKKSYQSKISLSFIFSENDQELFHIFLHVNSKVKSGATIKEDTKGAISINEMNEDESMKLQQKLVDVFSKLMS